MRMMLIIFSFLACAQLSFAQSAETRGDDDPYDSKSWFMFGLNYLSNNVYLGRKDTMMIPYYSPYIGYHFSSGLYAKAILSYTTAKGSHLDLTTLEAGYDHSFGDHFDGGLNVDKYFYNKNSISVRANTKVGAGIYGQYNNDWVEPQLTADVNFNKASTDYVIGLLLDHDFSLAEQTLHITPAAGVNAGTQHYLDEYFTNRLTKNDKTIKVKHVLANSSKFVVLDYELSCKATYRVSKWLFTLTPTYAMPVSPATVTIPATKNKPETVLTEKLKNSFYVELDICHR